MSDYLTLDWRDGAFALDSTVRPQTVFRYRVSPSTVVIHAYSERLNKQQRQALRVALGLPEPKPHVKHARDHAGRLIKRNRRPQ